MSLRSNWPEKLWHKRWDEHLQRLVGLRTKVNESTLDAALPAAESDGIYLLW
ncbi:hypothetical protein ACFVW2_22640 [Streptomyces sp. NPDC058171]